VNPHPHKGFHFHGVLEGARLDGHRFNSGDGRRSLGIHFFIDAVPVHIRSKVQSLLVELLDRGRNLDRKPDDLVGNQLFLQRSAGLGTVIHDPHDVASIKTVGRPMIARVGVMEHGDRHSS